jgi:hypothetical protein
MTRSVIIEWISKILRIAIILLLIGGLVDVLLIVARHGAGLFRPGESAKQVLNTPISSFSHTPEPAATPKPIGPFDDLLTNPEMAAKPVVKETLYLYVSPQQIFATYDIYLPKDHPLFVAVQNNYGPATVDILVKEILGTVTVTGKLLEFQAVDVSISPEDVNAHLFITSDAAYSEQSDQSVRVSYPYKPFNLRFEEREVVVKTDKAQVWGGALNIPFSRTSDTTVFKRAQNPNEFRLDIHFTEGVVDTAPPVPQIRTLAEFLGQGISPPGFNTFLFGILAALPFLLLLVWSRKFGFAKEQTDFQSKIEAVQLYLVFHFTLYFLLAVNVAQQRWGNPAVWALRRWQQSRIPGIDLLQWYDHHELVIPIMTVFVSVWPLMVIRWERRNQTAGTSWKERGAQVVLAVALAALAVWTAFAVSHTLNSPIATLRVADFYSSILGTLFLALAASVLWLSFEMFDRGRASAALITFFSLVFLIALRISFGLSYNLTDKKFAIMNMITFVVIFFATALALTYTFGVLIHRLITGDPVSRTWRTLTQWKRLLVVVGILAIALSTRRIWPPVDIHLISLSMQLKDLFLLGVIWMLVDFLSNKSSDALWLQLPRSTRRAGVLLALVSFYSSTTRWNYIPIEFIAGFLLLDKWLLPARHFDKGIFAAIQGKLPEIIKKVINFNDEEKTLALLKKELLTKVAKAELSHEAYDERYKAQNIIVETLKQELTVKDHFAKDHFAKNYVLAFGPTDSAWRNGKKAALYSLLFAIPWAVLFMRTVIRGPVFEDSYLILGVCVRILFFFFRWLSYGFILGYFYPYIKGKNGFQKGLSLFITATIPTLIWTVLALPQDSENWYGFGFWVLQIFVHTMLLGLVAGDYETLRKAGYRWKHLLEIHRFGELSAWASSVLIAIGAAISALIATGASQLVIRLLKFAAENVQSATSR